MHCLQLARLTLIFNLDNSLLRKCVRHTYRTRLDISYQRKSFLSTLTQKVEQQKKLKVAFFGTDLLSIKILTGLHSLTKDNIIQEVCVVTSASAKKSSKKFDQANNNKASLDLANFRGNQIIDYCARNNISYHTWSNIDQNNEYLDLLKSCDVGVVASFGHLIPSKLIELFPYGIVNIHPSLLPRWRGASPLIFSILFGDRQVGVSLMKIQANFFDIGPVITQEAVDLPSESTTSFQLLDYLGNIGNQMVIDLFKNFDNMINQTTAQSSSNVTYAHKITSQMFYVDWSDQTCQEIDCQYRALHEINHLKTKLNGKVVKLLDIVRPESFDSQDLPNCRTGTIRYLKKEKLIVVKCKNGFVGFKGLVLRQKLTATDFYNGYLNNRSGVQFESVANSIKENIFVAKAK